MSVMRQFKTITIVFIVIVVTSCATYYQKNEALMASIYQGNYTAALSNISHNKTLKSKRNRLLYYLNKGTIEFMAGMHEESNKSFRQADYFVEDFQKNYLAKSASFLTNPNIEPYEGESFEKILIHYYTTLNYLQQNKLDEALIECKRMQLKLQKNIDYFGNKNKYKNDAFVHLLTGIVYDAQLDYNNAFIAYRNAYQFYKTEYKPNFNTDIPYQLKLDLIRTAELSGFKEEGQFYRNEFNSKDYQYDKFAGHMVAFWNNGFGPIKTEWSINFTIIPGANGWVTFSNHDLGLHFNYYAGNDAKALSNLNVIRVAFPKYTSRIPVFNKAQISIDSIGLNIPFYEAQNIDKIAYTSLNDRMFKEMSEALLRLALKQLSAAALKKENEGLGVALNLMNAITEQADTRNWQTLPFQISYTRISLNEAKYPISISFDNQKLNSSITIKRNQTKFLVYQSPYFKGYN